MAPELRPDYLTVACGQDIQLRHDVESLLESVDQTLGSLAKPIQNAAQAVTEEPALPGRRIGPYKILRTLGESGIGTVLLAARADERFGRQVAIKLIHAGLGHSASMQARFRAERQILANLDHPNIARLLDGGVTLMDSASVFASVPYLVMEYVDGVPVDVYCRQNGLSIEQRLRLFLVGCAAVEYAHNNLVVHRDIKPANILVSASGIPKLLDFGIAKLLDAEIGDDPAARTPATERLMTPDCASPEQIRGDPVTTATDVHALGALLYELLTGRPALQVATKSSPDVAGIICEQEPPLPSTALIGSQNSAAEARKLKGDLDNIVLMAMRKDPVRRYTSVAQLAGDVRAYLENYPLIARTDRWGYRSQKFVRRHKIGVAVGIVMMLALMGFSTAMGILARRAKREQEIAQRQTQFLSDMFQASTPEQARGTIVTARDLLDRGAKRVDKEFPAQPGVRASLLENIAGAYKSLGVLDEAEKLAQRSYGLQTQISGADNLATAGSLELLATVTRLQGRYQRAEPLFRRLVAIRQRALGNSHNDVATALSELGECLYLENKDSEAEPTLRRALMIDRGHGADLGSGTRNYLALVIERKGEYSEATALLREAADIDRRVDGHDSPNYAITLHNLGSALINSGDMTGAEAELREALAIRRKVLGNNHPDLYYSLNNLAFVLLNKGEWDSAESFAEEGLALNRRQLGEEHPLTAGAWNGLARISVAKSEFSLAEQQYRRALEILRALNQSDGYTATQINLNFAMLDLDRGQYAEAEGLARQSLDRFRKLGGDDTLFVASAEIELAQDRISQGDPQSAETLLRHALKIRERTFPARHSAIIFVQTRLGEALIGEDEFAQAEPILRQAVASAQKPDFPLPVWQVAEPESALGACLAALGLRSEAEKLIEHSEAGLRKDPRPLFRHSATARLRDISQVSVRH
jgi:eukaryotic-like serine/threonine-protein kinase